MYVPRSTIIMSKSQIYSLFFFLILDSYKRIFTRLSVALFHHDYDLLG